MLYLNILLRCSFVVKNMSLLLPERSEHTHVFSHPTLTPVLLHEQLNLAEKVFKHPSLVPVFCCEWLSQLRKQQKDMINKDEENLIAPLSIDPV